jgi:putative Holliday junction resolvase
MRILAVDFGERRLGLAVSDPTGLIARSWGIVERTSDAQAAERVAQIAGELAAGTILLGLPSSRGEADAAVRDEGPQARRVRRFGAILAEKCALELIYFDESMTSVDAADLLRQRGERRSRRRQPVDAIAAAIFLQAYLDGLAARRARE